MAVHYEKILFQKQLTNLGLNYYLYLNGHLFHPQNKYEPYFELLYSHNSTIVQVILIFRIRGVHLLAGRTLLLSMIQ